MHLIPHIELLHTHPMPMAIPHPKDNDSLTDLDREEYRIAAPMQEVLVQHYGQIVHMDVHVAA